MATTTENLKDAFAGESQANQKYRAFAKKAEKEGFANVARLFSQGSFCQQLRAAKDSEALFTVATSQDI